MTNITKPTRAELDKWRAQSRKAAKSLKGGAAVPKAGANVVRVGFAFDDDAAGVRVIALDISLADIERMNVVELADHVYDAVLQKAQAFTAPGGSA